MNCGHCEYPLVDCHCTVDSMRAAEFAPHVMCSNCGLERPLKGFEDCKACTAALLLVETPDAMDALRRVGAGTSWLAELERELARQAAALVPAGEQFEALQP